MRDSLLRLLRLSVLLTVLFTVAGPVDALTRPGGGTAASGANTTLTPTLGITTQSGDLCIVYTGMTDSNQSANLDVSGYTLKLSQNATNHESGVWMKIVGAAEGNPSVTITGGDVNDTMIAYAECLRPGSGRQFNLATVVAHSTSQTNSASQTVVPYQALTITTANTYTGVYGYYRNEWTSATIASPPTNMTEKLDLSQAAGANGAMTVWTGIQTTATNVTASNIDITGGLSSTTSASIVFSLQDEIVCSGSPTITDVDTDETVSGSQANVVITGTNFCAEQLTGSVQWRDDGAPCTQSWSVDSWSDTSIQVDVTYGSCRCGSGNVRVTNTAANSDDQAITIDVTPAITDVDTDEILTATQTNFSIAGTGFCAQGAGTLTLRDASANSKTLNVDTWTDTAIQGDVSGVGAGVTNGLLYGGLDVRVTNNDAGTDDQAVTVNPPSGTTSTTLSGGLVTLAWDAYGNPNRLYGVTLDLQDTSQVATLNLQGTGDLTVNADGSIEADDTLTAFDYDFSRGGLYVGTVGTWELAGIPPTFGGLPIPDQVYAKDTAIVTYDLADYFTPGDEAISAYSLKKLSSPSNTTQANGSGTASTALVVDSVAGIGYGAWILVNGYKVQVLVPNHTNNTLQLFNAISWDDNDTVALYSEGAGDVTGLGLTASDYGGTPTAVEIEDLLVFRAEDDAGLTADLLVPITISSVEVDWIGDAGSTAISTMLGQGLTVNPEYPCNNPAPDVVQALDIDSVLFGSVINLDVSRHCVRKIIHTGF